MAEKEGGATKAAPPPRLALPPRPTGENLFRSGGGAAGVSPGPMTLVSSFFAEEPESDCRSFLQLLAGAMASPAAALGGGALAALPSSSGEERERSTVGSNESTLSPPAEEREKKSVDGDVRSQRMHGLGPPFFMLPPIPSPTGLPESPTFFLPGQGSFGISHQQALAQVTAQALQAAQAHGNSHFPSDHSPALPPPASSAVGAGTARPAAVATADGYNWRKYGQKKVKCSEFPRSYYKCTHPNCQVKKKVEKSLDGQVVEITYKGQHNHPLPSSGKRPKGGAAAAAAPAGGGGWAPEGSSPPPGDPTEAEEGNFDGEDEPVGSGEASRSRSDGGQIVEQLSGLSDVEDMDETEVRTGRGKDPRQDPKRRKMEAQPGEAAAGTMSKVAVPVEPKIIVQTTSEVDLLDDGYRWRKYGQKVVKGNPNPRSYYKCTSPGCNARKHIERSSTDHKVVITTYERKHNHGVPGARAGVHGQITDALSEGL